jgi:hypothetical protein
VGSILDEVIIFSIDLIHPAALWLTARLNSSTEINIKNISLGKGRPERKTNNFTAICETLFTKCEIIDISQPYGSPRPVIGIALLPFLLCYESVYGPGGTKQYLMWLWKLWSFGKLVHVIYKDVIAILRKLMSIQSITSHTTEIFSEIHRYELQVSNRFWSRVVSFTVLALSPEQSGLITLRI